MAEKPHYLLPHQGKERTVAPNRWDIVALVIAFGLIIALISAAENMNAPYHLGEMATLSLSPYNLPHYALRSVLRLFIAIVLSIAFSFIFGTLAAKNKHAERLIIPLVDILQSIPILGYLSIMIVALIRLFPGSLLGPECAAILAIFTSQAWNMMLSFYQSVRNLPKEMREAAQMLQLSAWQCFWRVEVPYAMPGFLWNMMLSLSAGWFFVVASEAISVSGQTILLPGIGSYIQLAIDKADLYSVLYAIITMFAVILLYDQLLFRPLIRWAEKFKSEETDYDEMPNSWVFNLLRRTHLLHHIAELIRRNLARLVMLKTISQQTQHATQPVTTLQRKRKQWFLCLWYALLGLVIVASSYQLLHFILKHLRVEEIAHVFVLGGYTSLRVFILVLLCTCVWLPIGVWIGLNPKLTAFCQPIAQFLASFPSNLLFPPIVSLIVAFNLNVNIWTAPLMILGTQWYILFNVIAGAASIPRDLKHVAQNFGVKRLLWWKRIALPAVFPYFITGALSAAGGAWNASIIAEYVQWGDRHLAATGLGAYITQYTSAGDFPRIALGIGVMCVFVLTFNRLLWKPLYHWSEQRFAA